MKKVLTEETVLFISVLKWIVLATFIGTIVGFSTAVFLKLLNLSMEITFSYPYNYLFLPAALFLSTISVMYLAPDARGHGTEKVIEAVHRNSGKIKPAVVPVKLFATIVTIAGGGSAGKEGPCAQIGAGLSSMVADLFRFDDEDRKKLVICGISAGFASVFGTPTAGAIFGVEVLYAGSILYEVLLPSFIAGVIGYRVTSALGITYFFYPLKAFSGFSSILLIKVVLGGVFFGICSRLFIEILGRIKKLKDGFALWEPLKALAGGFILIILCLISSKDYLGLGLKTIHSSLEGGEVVWYAFLMKMLFTSITLNFGGSGGIVTPIFFIGATSGTFFAKLFGLDRPIFSSIGFVALLAGAANTPISASIMSVELFGAGIAPYASIACIISFIMTGHRSVYPSQILAIKKSASIEVEMGRELEHVKPRFRPRVRSLIYTILKLFKQIK
ncbi:MAG: chloride channel protein [Spirochaetota bacterium]